MTASFALPALDGVSADALTDLTSKAKTVRMTKAKGAAEDFEAVFLNSMMQQMFSGLGKGPFGGGPAAGIWRSFLTDEYSKSMVKAGGIGLASEVQRSLLAHQEAAR